MCDRNSERWQGPRGDSSGALRAGASSGFPIIGFLNVVLYTMALMRGLMNDPCFLGFTCLPDILTMAPLILGAQVPHCFFQPESRSI